MDAFARERRFGGALGASLAAHAAVLILLAALAGGSQVMPIADQVMTASLRFVLEPGPGGGGGGSDQPRVAPRPAPPARAPVQADAVMAPVPIRLSLTPAARPLDMPGAITGLSAPIALAPGNPGGTGAPGAGAGPGTGDGVGPGEGGNTGGDAYGPGDNVTLPQVIYERKPTYTIAAVQARIQGEVELEAVVLANGSVAFPRVVRSLDPGLDQQAIVAVSQWRFTPGRHRDTSEPVNVRVRIVLAFSLR